MNSNKLSNKSGSILIITLLAIFAVVILLTSFISISKDASFESLKVVEHEKMRLIKYKFE